MPTLRMDSIIVHPFLVRREPDAAPEWIPRLRGNRTTEDTPKMIRAGRGVKSGRPGRRQAAQPPAPVVAFEALGAQ